MIVSVLDVILYTKEIDMKFEWGIYDENGVRLNRGSILAQDRGDAIQQITSMIRSERYWLNEVR